MIRPAHVHLVPPLVLALLALAGCQGSDKAEDPLAERDPAVTGALSDPIMADPDLASQNRGGSALSGGGPASGEVPPFKRGEDEIEAAKTAAIEAVGGEITPAPAATAQAAQSPLARAVTAEAAARALNLAGAACTGKVSYSFAWGARLAAPFAPYPRGHVQEAAGSDAAGCRLRAVSYVTPVDLPAVLDFHYTLLRRAGLAAEHRRAGDDEVLAGKGFAIHLRRRADGLSEALVVTSGY